MKLKNKLQTTGIFGAVIGGILGLSFGYWFIYLPGVGSPFISGLIIGWIFTAISGAMVVGGLSAFGAGVYLFVRSNVRKLQSMTGLKLASGPL